CQRPALVRGEGRHGGARAPGADDTHEFLLVHAGPEQRIVEGRRRPDLPVGPVAAGAVPPIECLELHDLIVRHRPVGAVGPTRQTTAGRQDTAGDEQTRHGGGFPHVLAPSPCLLVSLPGPRPAGGMGINAVRPTTSAAATPKTNWETTNHGQSTRCWRTGL